MPTPRTLGRRLVAAGLVAAAAAFVVVAGGPARANDETYPAYGERYTLFESGLVRPLALSPDGKRLFACNTPDNRLEVFDVKPAGLQHVVSVPVGLEPVAVAARTNHEVWVVNHLSDSVSVVLIAGKLSQVVRTLLVGDEPRDIVFAGPARSRAFVTTAHRGQNAPYDPQLTTPGIGRADVWVFDAAALGAPLGGTPQTILSLFCDTPRALAVTPDGTKVYAAGFFTGNKTATVQGFSIPFDFGTFTPTYPGPHVNFQGVPAPAAFPFSQSIIVKFDGEHWRDETGGIHDDAIRFSLPDKDVFAIDAMASPPALVTGAAGAGFFPGVGTVLFNMVVNPVNGKVYVSNTDANNLSRFEGPGIFAGQTVRGNLAKSRITVLTPGAGAGSVQPRHLNKHIDYSQCCDPIPNAENAKSLAFPVDMVVTSNGETLYVAAFGSSKVGVYSTAQLEADTFTPDPGQQIPLTGGGPAGLALDESAGRLYVLTRFDNAISIVDTASKVEIGKFTLYNPEPPHIVEGRRFLYDASFTSSHGDSACASCHTFGDFDALAWDLGNPDAQVLPISLPLSNTFANALRPPGGIPEANIPPPPLFPDGTPLLHPMKGPMTTQSLRGMANHGPMHWRGDRAGDGPSVQPASGAFDEDASFKEFNVAFEGLNGRHAPLTPPELQKFTDFILEVSYPPNPIRNLDDSLTESQQRGHDKFFVDQTTLFTSSQSCNACHVLDPQGNAEYEVKRPGFFGTDGRWADIFAPQFIKNPHLRNQYQKIGMFGNPPALIVNPGNNQHMGDQVRGFGFLHDGSVDTVFRFMQVVFFNQHPIANPNGIPAGPDGDQLRRDFEAFQLAFPTNLKPIVGQQATLGLASHGPAVQARLDLFETRADAGDCNLVVRASADLGFLYLGDGVYRLNRAGFPPLPGAVVKLVALLKPLTFTCVPPGAGERIGLDRDEDGVLDGDE